MMKAPLAMMILGVGLLVMSCDRDPHRGFPVPEARAAGLETAGASALPPAIEQSVRQKGEAVAAQAFGVLSSRLGQAIAEAGHTNAITFCSVHGLALTSAVGVTNDVVLRRVTHRPRSSRNRADANELALIRHYQREIAQGRALRAVVTTNKAAYFTYYSPIVLNLPLCLSCHGQPGTDISSATLEQIKKSYPTDEATGFKLGQVRGLWSVDFKRSDFPDRPDR